MIKIDMHVHSMHSKNPSEWFLQKIGAHESYTPVEDVYRRCKERGMTYVTLTDHNTIDGALELHAAHPDDTFVSVESTAYFPEDGCKVHVLCYNITPEQFSIIQKLRSNIYELRNYLRDECVVCSVAHATYSVNGRLSAEILEKLILLFDRVFTDINSKRLIISMKYGESDFFRYLPLNRLFSHTATDAIPHPQILRRSLK